MSRRKNKMTREQRIMFTRIFIGLDRQEDKANGIKSEKVRPSLDYMVMRFPEVDVEPVATQLWMDLLQKGTVFNYTYWLLKLDDKCKREYNKLVTQLKRETKGLATGDIVTDMNQPDPIEPPEIAWKEPLTEGEKLMVSYLMEDMSQREIYSEFGIHPSRQGRLREGIRRKMEVI